MLISLEDPAPAIMGFPLCALSKNCFDLALKVSWQLSLTEKLFVSRFSNFARQI